MRKGENILMTVAAIAVGFSVLAYNFAGSIAPDIVEIPEVSNLENRYYTERPELTVESAMEGDYQESLESYLADHIPCRDLTVLFNAGLQRVCVAASAFVHGFDVYPTFFGSRYYAIPQNRLIVDRAEELPSEEGMRALDAWVETLNEAARKHPDVRFVYDCVARHDQTEANPTYQYYRNRLNPSWVQANLIERLDPHIDAFIDAVESYDEIIEEWLATDPHWTLGRALKSYNQVARRLSLVEYPYENALTVVESWQGSYAKSGLDLDYPLTLEDLPLDFSNLTFSNLQEDGGAEKQMGMRDDVLRGDVVMVDNGASKYYDYFGGGAAEASNTGPSNGKKLLFIGDSLSYCLTRFIAANYDETVFLLPGNGRYDSSLESYLEYYDPDDVIILMHASKYEMIAEYSPAFIGLDG